MSDTLRSVGYDVTEAGNAAELAERVHHAALLSAPISLLVIGAKLSTQCAVPISVAASQRWHLQLSPLKVAVLFEWGTLGTVERPQLHHCEMLAMLEKPFHMSELEELAKLALAQVA
jgi:hypothetical protein